MSIRMVRERVDDVDLHGGVAMIELEVRCRVCRRLWVPLHGDYVRGTWKVCPRCRSAATPPPPPKGGAA